VELSEANAGAATEGTTMAAAARAPTAARVVIARRGDLVKKVIDGNPLLGDGVLRSAPVSGRCKPRQAHPSWH
jgi:hypothetical protein